MGEGNKSESDKLLVSGDVMWPEREIKEPDFWETHTPRWPERESPVSRAALMTGHDEGFRVGDFATDSFRWSNMEPMEGWRWR